MINNASQLSRSLLLARNKIWTVCWEANCWWEAWALHPCLPLKSGPGARSEGWPHHGRTFSILLSFWSTLPLGVLPTSWCPPRPCVVFLVHLALFLALSLSPGCFLMVWPQYTRFPALTVYKNPLFTPALLRAHSFIFFAAHETHRIVSRPFISKASRKTKTSFRITITFLQDSISRWS